MIFAHVQQIHQPAVPGYQLQAVQPAEIAYKIGFLGYHSVTQRLPLGYLYLIIYILKNRS